MVMNVTVNEFVNIVTTLRECDVKYGCFSKAQFEDVARLNGAHFATLLDRLRNSNLVTLHHVDDVSIVVDKWDRKMDISKEEYEKLPDCVYSALDWKVQPRTKNWYVVNKLVLAQVIANVKAEVEENLTLIYSL